MGSVAPRTLDAIYRRLFSAFGPQHWWPGETPFEVAVGAILAQNTSWSNASSAVQALKRRGLLDPRRIALLPSRRLASLIRSSGYFNQKAKRLKVFVAYLNRRYGGEMSRMRKIRAVRLRGELLGLWGIGPETADSILLYALGKPVFVVDAYTRRVLSRHSLISPDAGYEEIQTLFAPLPWRGRDRLRRFNEYHALIVQLGKSLCRPSPRCSDCPLRRVGRLRLETPLFWAKKRKKHSS